MILVINGQPRSGSTLAFNIARTLAERSNMLAEARGATASEIHEMLDWERKNPTDRISVYKCHYFLPPIGVHLANLSLIYTYRNPLDVLTSNMRVPENVRVRERMGEAPFIDALEFDYSHFIAMQWLPNSDYKVMSRYEDFYNNVAEGLVLQIVITMRLRSKFSSANLQEIADEFSKEKMKRIGDAMLNTAAGVDPETHVRAGHVSESLGAPGSWHGKLPDDIVDRVKRQFKMWMKECFWS